MQIWYAYVHNDPVNLRDLWGLCSESDQKAEVKVIEGVEIAPPIGNTWDEFDDVVTSPFGPREPFTCDNGMTTNAVHGGMDFGAEKGTRVNSVMGGTVVSCKTEAEDAIYGNNIIIEHPTGSHLRYSHLDCMNVSLGDEVEAGQKIGEVGETGMATGPHLDVQWDGDCDGVFDRNNRMDNPANLFFGGAY